MDMQEKMAVTGYVPDTVARTLKEKGTGTVEVAPERGIGDVVARVQRSEIAEAWLGSSSKGETFVQLILVKEATVESLIRARADTKGLRRFHDPNLSLQMLRAAPAVIMR
jgi:hypothetical protein